MDLAQQPGVDDLIKRALAEDIGLGDVTTSATVKPDARGQARITVKEEEMVFCGGPLIAPILERCGAQARIEKLAAEGAILHRGAVAVEIEGLVAGLLIGERTALNFLQLMSGIATKTAQYVSAIAGTRARIVDTRKTHPGLRAVEKYAVRVGGGYNHRFGLDSGVLIKDNHIAAAGSVGVAIKLARQAAPHTLKIEIECETLAQLEEAITAGADVVLLDNMTLEDVRRACQIAAGRVQLEVSGNVTLATVGEIARTGVDLISIGDLTHSVRAADLSMRIEAF
ncbi:MAG TPA: carboxylating nicotinate-nucleotide diphosphorylase [Candidatus Binataceae bacterium]|jgi:nicotinate-nucleotide pyrophosphorylase (carboxylating)|nr:carboxylating nicotinate-nucleotide diphosphorylase [Candidatus Binataceae bacterium]